MTLVYEGAALGIMIVGLALGVSLLSWVVEMIVREWRPR